MGPSCADLCGSGRGVQYRLGARRLDRSRAAVLSRHIFGQYVYEVLLSLVGMNIMAPSRLVSSYFERGLDGFKSRVSLLSVS